MKLAHTQKGMSSIGWLLVLLVLGFTLLCLFRMVPAYVDDRFIQEALKSLTEDVNKVDEMSNEEIRKKVGHFFVMNNIRSQSPKIIEIERTRDAVLVSANYEVRVPIIYNVDVVMTFNNVWDSQHPLDCCKSRNLSSGGGD